MEKWHVGIIAGNGIAIYGKHGEQVADLSGNLLEKSETVANARLIASAPELLEALEAMIEQAQETYPHFESERGQKNIELAKLAISQAKGE